MTNTQVKLFQDHLADLRKSTLMEKIVEEMGVYSMTPDEFKQKVGYRYPGVESYLAFPYPGKNGFERYKLFPPPKDGDGKELKYFQPKDSGCHLYILPQVRKVLADSSVPIFLIEGEKKASALVQIEKATIGLAGVWNWLVGKTHKPIPDLDEIVWKDRVAYLVPDSDAWRKDEVLLAVYRLGKELERRGAIVQIVRLPDLLGLEKTGADDYLSAKRIKAFQRLVTNAISLKNHTFRTFQLQEDKKTREKADQESQEAKERQQAEAAARSQVLLSTSTDLYQIHAKLEDLSSASHDLIELVLAAAISLPVAKKNDEAMVWLLVVGNPSSDKTNQVSLLREMPNIYFLDTLTENAFVTGYISESGDGPKDLLAELDGKCLVVKELGVLFSMKAELIRKVLGDLQAIYDGHFAKYTGTRGKVEYTAAFPFIGCVTPLALNQHQRYMASIGPRFLFYRVLPLSENQRKDGFELSWQEEKRKKGIEELRRLVSAYGWQLYNSNHQLIRETPEQQARLNELAEFLCCGRAVVLTERRQDQGEDGKRSFTRYEHVGYQKEEPWRALQQLRSLARSLVVIHQRDHLTDHELELLRRVVLSSMPPDRAEALRLFQEGSLYLDTIGRLNRAKAADGLKLSYNQAKRLLQELQSLGLLEAKREPRNEGDQHTEEWFYWPVERFAELITRPLVSIDHLLDLEEGAKNLPQVYRGTPDSQNHAGRGVEEVSGKAETP